MLPFSAGAKVLFFLNNNFTRFSCVFIDILIDYIISKEGIPVAIEVNAVPGMAATSLFPRAAEAYGIEFDDLVEKIVLLAAEGNDWTAAMQEAAVSEEDKCGTLNNQTWIKT